MVVFILPILLRIIDPKINGNNRCSIGSDRRDQVDALNDPVVLSTPVPGYHVNLMRIRFVQGAVVKYQYTIVMLDHPFCFIIQRLRVVRLPL
jgi:hypothetical protein